MSTPIGAIEFLVKFDTMSRGFQQALRNVISDIHVDVSGGFNWEARHQLERVEQRCEEILFLIKERLRTPFTQNYQAFIGAVAPQIAFARDEMTKKRLADVLRAAPTAKKYFGELTIEESLERAEDMLKQYIIKLEQAAADKDFFKKNVEKIVDLSSALNQILMGKWQHKLKPFMEQTLDKDFIVQQYKKLLSQLGIEAEFKPRQWGYVKEPIEYGETLPHERTRTPVRSLDDLINSMGALIKEMELETHAPDIFKRFLAGEPKFSKREMESVYGKFISKWFQKYKIEKGAELPRSMLRSLEHLDPKLFEKVWPEEIRRKGPRKDVFFMLTKKTLESLKTQKLKEVLKQSEIKELEKEILKETEITEPGKILDELEKFWKRHGVQPEKRRAIEKTLEEIGVAPFFDKISQFIKRTETKKELGAEPLYTKEQIEALTAERRDEEILQRLKMVGEDLKYLKSKSEGYEEKGDIERLLRRLEEYLEYYGDNPRTPRE